MCKWGWFILIPVLMLLIFILKKYATYQDDNPIEEAVEEVIKDETGADVDLTPDSPEKKLDGIHM